MITHRKGKSNGKLKSNLWRKDDSERAFMKYRIFCVLFRNICLIVIFNYADKGIFPFVFLKQKKSSILKTETEIEMILGK